MEASCHPMRLFRTPPVFLSDTPTPPLQVASLGASIDAAIQQQAALTHLAAALQLNTTGDTALPYMASMPVDFLVSVLDRLQLRPYWASTPPAPVTWPANPLVDAQVAQAAQAAEAYDTAQGTARGSLAAAEAWQGAHAGSAAAAANAVHPQPQAASPPGSSLRPGHSNSGTGRRLLADITTIQTRTDVAYVPHLPPFMLSCSMLCVKCCKTCVLCDCVRVPAAHVSSFHPYRIPGTKVPPCLLGS